MEIRKPNLSSAAVILKKRLAEQGITVSHTEALEHAAAMEGYQSYQAYQAHQKEMEHWEKPALVMEAPAECGADYRYVGPHNTSVWIRMRNISVKLLTTDEGVVVDLYASGAEDDDSLSSTYSFYNEATEVQLERAEDLDDMRDHMKRLLRYERVKVEKEADSNVWRWTQGKKRGTDATFSDEWSAYVNAFETVFE